MKKIVLTLCILAYFFNFYAQNTKIPDSLINEWTKFIESQMKSKKIVGTSIAIIDNQETVWAKGFGYSDKENKTPATANTVYRCGSISKLMTATAIMQIVEKGILNLDNPVSDYIPEFAPKSRFQNQIPITTKMLLTHHSGLPSDIFDKFFHPNPPYFTSIIDYLNKEYVCTPPNYILSYSNAGFSVLGCIVEELSQKRFADYTESFLFEKMKMQNTSFEPNDEILKLYSKSYQNNGEKFDEPIIRDLSAGMLHSNVMDLANFIKMTFNDGNFEGNQIISAENLKLMQTQQNKGIVLDGSTKIGLSWFLDYNSGMFDYAGNVAHHGGDTYLYHSMLFTLPDQKVGFVILTNSENGHSIISPILEKIMQDYLKYIKKIEPKEKSETKPQKNVYVKFSDTEIKEDTGCYILGTSPMQFVAKNNKIFTRQNGIKLRFLKTDQGFLVPRVILLGFIPITMSKQKMKIVDFEDKEVLYYFNNKDSAAIGCATEKPKLNEIWQNRVGKYEIEGDTSELKILSDFEIKTDNGFLILECDVFNSSQIICALKPVTDNEAIVDGIGRNTGFTVLFDDENKKIYFSGMTLLKSE